MHRRHNTAVAQSSRLRNDDNNTTMYYYLKVIQNTPSLRSRVNSATADVGRSTHARIQIVGGPMVP